MEGHPVAVRLDADGDDAIDLGRRAVLHRSGFDRCLRHVLADDGVVLGPPRVNDARRASIASGML